MVGILCVAAIGANKLQWIMVARIVCDRREAQSALAPQRLVWQEAYAVDIPVFERNKAKQAPLRTHQDGIRDGNGCFSLALGWEYLDQCLPMEDSRWGRAGLSIYEITALLRTFQGQVARHESQLGHMALRIGIVHQHIPRCTAALRFDQQNTQL